MSEIQNPNLKIYKTIIIGKSGVGKSTILLRYIKGQFYYNHPTTLALDYFNKKVYHGQTEFILQLWDTAGQERFRTIVYNYFSLSKAAIIVFDINEEGSLDDTKTWLQQLVSLCGNDIPKVLLGNKCDGFTQKELDERISQLKGRIDELKAEYNCQFFAVSAKTDVNIDEAFNYLVGQIYEKNKVMNNENKNGKMKLAKSKLYQDRQEKNKDKKCC